METREMLEQLRHQTTEAAAISNDALVPVMAKANELMLALSEPQPDPLVIQRRLASLEFERTNSINYENHPMDEVREAAYATFQSLYLALWLLTERDYIFTPPPPLAYCVKNEENEEEDEPAFQNDVQVMGGEEALPVHSPSHNEEMDVEEPLVEMQGGEEYVETAAAGDGEDTVAEGGEMEEEEERPLRVEKKKDVQIDEMELAAGCDKVDKRGRGQPRRKRMDNDERDENGLEEDSTQPTPPDLLQSNFVKSKSVHVDPRSPDHSSQRSRRASTQKKVDYKALTGGDEGGTEEAKEEEVESKPLIRRRPSRSAPSCSSNTKATMDCILCTTFSTSNISSYAIHLSKEHKLSPTAARIFFVCDCGNASRTSRHLQKKTCNSSGVRVVREEDLDDTVSVARRGSRKKSGEEKEMEESGQKEGGEEEEEGLEVVAIERSGGRGRKRKIAGPAHSLAAPIHLKCVFCKRMTTTVGGFRVHLKSKHNMNPTQANISFRCGCGVSFKAPTHRNNPKCSRQSVTLIHNGEEVEEEREKEEEEGEEKRKTEVLEEVKKEEEDAEDDDEATMEQNEKAAKVPTEEEKGEVEMIQVVDALKEVKEEVMEEDEEEEESAVKRARVEAAQGEERAEEGGMEGVEGSAHDDDDRGAAAASSKTGGSSQGEREAQKDEKLSAVRREMIVQMKTELKGRAAGPMNPSRMVSED